MTVARREGHRIILHYASAASSDKALDRIRIRVAPDFPWGRLPLRPENSDDTRLREHAFRPCVAGTVEAALNEVAGRTYPARAACVHGDPGEAGCVGKTCLEVGDVPDVGEAASSI